MQLLNHNVNIQGIIYHIQTELINRKKVDVIISQIFQEGEVIWSKKNVYAKNEVQDYKEYMSKSHKNAILYLKNIFGDDKAQSIKINILKLNNLITKFKDDFGRGIFFIELFKRNDGTLVSGYNQNKFATDVYYSVYQELMSKMMFMDIPQDEFKYVYFEITEEVALVLGNIKNTPISFSFLIDLKKLGIGMFFNAIYPKFISVIKNEIGA